MHHSDANFIAFLTRAGAICKEDKRSVNKALTTLVRSCEADHEPLERA